MGEIVSERNLSKSVDGWRFEYRVRCDDGRRVVVDAACSRAAAEATISADIRAYLADSGRMRALEETDRHLPGITHIRLWVDNVTGRIRVDPR
jgi:hypothetical protein